MMTAPERGILLLCCALGDREARPLSTARFRELSKRAAAMGLPEGAEPSADVREKDLRRLGCSAADAAQVTAGGIRTDEFSAQTLESRLCPGLYAAGEVLDIDGDCGGYNLQWAWSSGRLAGQLLTGRERHASHS